MKSGQPHTGKPKWGYTYYREPKSFEVDPVQGEVLAQTYARSVAGESLQTLARWFNAHGWRTVEDGPWSGRSLMRTLDSGFGAGLFRWRGELRDGIHDPVIERETWQACLDARVARRKIPPLTTRSRYLLSGMVRCARCGGTVTANKTDPAPDRRSARRAGTRGSDTAPGSPTSPTGAQTRRPSGPSGAAVAKSASDSSRPT